MRKNTIVAHLENKVINTDVNQYSRRTFLWNFLNLRVYYRLNCDWTIE